MLREHRQREHYAEGTQALENTMLREQREHVTEGKQAERTLR